MKKMKSTFKCFFAMLVMAMAFVVMGTTAQAAEETYSFVTCNDLSKNAGSKTVYYTVPAYSSIVIPISVPGKGGVYLANAGEGSSDLYGKIYTNAACTIANSDYYIGDIDDADYDTISFDKGGTYYLKVENSNRTTALKVGINGFFVSGTDRTVKSKTTTAVFQNDYNTWVLHKFKASKTGYIQVYTEEANGYSVNVKLLSSGKKALSDDMYTSSKYNTNSYFAVQKGKTYYIATKATSESMYNLNYKLTAVKEKSGSKKSKAVTIKKNKTVKGVQIANNKKSGNDWYKIKLTKRQKITFTISGKSTGNIDLKIKVIPASKNVRIWGDTMYIPMASTKKYSTNGKFPAGTYYLQVSKADSKSSGYYSIKWK